MATKVSSKASVKKNASLLKAPTGIQGLDEITGGGLAIDPIGLMRKSSSACGQLPKKHADKICHGDIYSLST